MVELIDSHTHITNEESNVEAYIDDIKLAEEYGVKRAMMVFTSKQELAAYDGLAPYNHFDFAYGIYPSETTEINEQDFIDLKAELTKRKFKALGEIGADYHYFPDNREVQMEIFRRQVMLADELNLPIIIHARDCIQDIYDVLKSTPCRRKGVMHCYSGSLEMAKEFIKLGYYISFSGTVTFKNNRRGVETLLGIDKNYIMCETDAPFLTPVPLRGKPNKSAYVKHVYEFCAEQLGMDLEEFKTLVKRNYERLFGE